MQTRRAAGRACAALAFAVVTSACGTTVPGATGNGSVVAGGAGASGLTGATGQTAAGGGATAAAGSQGRAFSSTGAVGGGATGGTDAVGGGAVATGAPGGGSATSTTGGSAGGVSGVQDKTPVKVGAFYLNGGNAALGAGFAATPVNFGDGQIEAKAVVADINAHGGIGGRPIQLFLQKIEATDASKPAAFEAACNALAEDHHVLAIMSMFNLRTPLAACASKHKTLLIDAALGAGDDAIYREYGNWAFTPAQMSLDTEQKLVLHNASIGGVISPKTKVGVVVQNDDEIYPRVQKNTIEPTLKSLGVPYEAQVIANAQDSSGISNAILKFKADGVSVVMFSCGNGGVPEVVFMQAAEQQQFRPAYVMGDSTDTWFVGSSAPNAQIQKITGVGSYPIANVEANQVPASASEKHCLDVISKGGEQVSDRHSSVTAEFYCETLYGFAAAGARVPGRLTADSWRAAYRGLGAEYPTITSFRVDVSQNPNAGGRGYRTLAYSSGCTCIVYTSGVKRL
jgi:ABC-type branched-subunit amino acid transport system substrate-binding protein